MKGHDYGSTIQYLCSPIVIEYSQYVIEYQQFTTRHLHDLLGSPFPS